MTRGNPWIVLAGLFGALGVATGAFQAHGLLGMLEQMGLPPAECRRRLDWCDLAVRYQLLHTVALLGTGLAYQFTRQRSWHLASLGFCLGIVLFSGSLLAMTATGQTRLGAVTPLGGVTLIAAWLGVVFAGLSQSVATP